LPQVEVYFPSPHLLPLLRNCIIILNKFILCYSDHVAMCPKSQNPFTLSNILEQLNPLDSYLAIIY
jgi:hypothetical protein